MMNECVLKLVEHEHRCVEHEKVEITVFAIAIGGANSGMRSGIPSGPGYDYGM